MESLTQKGHNVIFAGDGINDAPVLARSTVGVTMSALGSDAAMEATDLVIMDDNLNKLITALKIAKRTTGIAKQNIIFAISVKAVILILSLFELFRIKKRGCKKTELLFIAETILKIRPPLP